MAREILINVGAGEIRVALVVDGQLQDYSFEATDGAAAREIGDIVLGRVQRVMPGMQAAFMDIGLPRAGFLALSEARALAKSDNADISDCVREGEAILVQVIKDPIGEKGARLSAGIALPGRLLVLTPGQKGVALSRRIEDQARRSGLTQWGEAWLAQTMPDAGLIFRTAAQEASPEELRQDAEALAAAWQTIEGKRRSARPPALLHRDLGPLERALRDRMGSDVVRVLIDDAGAAEAARAYCRRLLPGAEAKIAFVDELLFERHDLEDEIARLSSPRAALAGGGWITIEATEALTAIDVNSGSHAGAAGLEETGRTVNLDAAHEIGRQVRLRGIGGLIVVDFIQMTEPKNRETVLAALAQSLAEGRVPVEISPLWESGIVAVTRKRVRQSLAQRTNEPCPTCAGSGSLPSAQTIARAIMRRVLREARAWPGRELVVTASPVVTAWLVAGDAAGTLARRGAGRVRFESDAMSREAFDVRPV